MIITTTPHQSGHDIIFTTDNCPGVCFRIRPGAEGLDECEHYHYKSFPDWVIPDANDGVERCNKGER